MFEDPLRGRNPFAVARYVRSRNAPCPVCGGTASIEASVKDDDVLAACKCPACGGSPLIVSVSDDGDIIFSFNGADYQPTFEEKEAAVCDVSDVRSAAEKFTSAARACSPAGRPAKAVSLLKQVADMFRSKIGSEGWEDASDGCLKAVIEATQILSENGNPSEAITLMEGYSDIDPDSPVGIDFKVACAIAHLRAD